MDHVMNTPLLVFALSVVVLWLAAQLGVYFHRRRRHQEEAEHEDLGVILAATLTLLGLIVGFSFSMAVRYDQRKNYEEAEANAITSIAAPTNPLKTSLSITGTPTHRTYRTSPPDRTMRFLTSHPECAFSICSMVPAMKWRSCGWTPPRYSASEGAPLAGSRP